MRARHSSAHTLLVLLAAESVVLAVAGMGRGVGVSSPQDKLVLRGGGAGNEAHSLPIRGPGTVPGSSNSSAPVGVADGQGSFQTGEAGSCEGFAGDGVHSHPAEMPDQTPGDLMGKMVGAMVTVNLKIGPQLCGRLQTIDTQMNMLLGRPVQQWVNGTVRLSACVCAFVCACTRTTCTPAVIYPQVTFHFSASGQERMAADSVHVPDVRCFCACSQLVSVDDADVFVRCHNVIDFGVLKGTEDPATVKILHDIGIRCGEGWNET